MSTRARNTFDDRSDRQRPCRFRSRRLAPSPRLWSVYSPLPFGSPGGVPGGRGCGVRKLGTRTHDPRVCLLFVPQRGRVHPHPPTRPLRLYGRDFMSRHTTWEDICASLPSGQTYVVSSFVVSTQNCRPILRHSLLHPFCPYTLRSFIPLFPPWRSLSTSHRNTSLPNSLLRPLYYLYYRW